MIETTITCDNCQREKQSTNKWWVLMSNNPSPARAIPPTLYAMPFSKAHENDISQGAHACSRECAHKIIEQWMEKKEAA